VLSSRLAGAMLVRACGPLGHDASRLGCAGRVREEEAGWAEPVLAQ
jgi:hypothetical protein